MFLISHLPVIQEQTQTVEKDRGTHSALPLPSAAEGVEVKPQMLEVIATLETRLIG